MARPFTPTSSGFYPKDKELFLRVEYKHLAQTYHRMRMHLKESNDTHHSHTFTRCSASTCTKAYNVLMRVGAIKLEDSAKRQLSIIKWRSKYA